MTGFALVEIELDDGPPPALRVPEDRAGIAVGVRSGGVPIGFWMEDLPAGTVLSADDVDHRIGHHCGEALLQHRVGWREPDGEAAPRLTMAVCTKDRPEGLDRTLGSIGAAVATTSVEIDLLVVDNASQDAQVAEVAAAHDARYVVEHRPGLDFARNRALDEARTAWVAFVDDDVVVDPVWFRGVRRALLDHPDAAAVTGLVLPLRLDTDAQVLFERRGGFRPGVLPRRIGAVAEHDDVHPAGGARFGTGANMAVHVPTVRSIGGFDPALDRGAPMPGGGDLDLFQRLVRAGHAVAYEPACLVFHDHRASMDDLRRQLADSWGMSHHAFLAKTWDTDPELRPAIRRHVARWLRSTGRDVVRSALGRSPVPLRLVLAELDGARRGAGGAYRASKAQVEALDAATVETAAPGRGRMPA